MSEIDGDAELMKQFAAGHEEAFVSLYHTYRNAIFNFTRRMLGSVALAEEATQEVFLKLYRARHRYEAKSRFSTYLFRIAKNHCLNFQARHDTRLVDRHSEAQDSADTRDQTSQKLGEVLELRRRISKAIANLPEKQRTAFVLAHFEGMNYEQIADIIEVSQGAVKSLVHRARLQLCQNLAPQQEAPEVAHGV